MKTKRLSFPLELKAINDPNQEQGLFEGLAAKFFNVDWNGEILMPGCFTNSLASRKPVMCWQHDLSSIIGKWLEIKETADGLSVQGKLCLDTQLGAEAYALLKMDAINTLSIGFITKDSTYDPNSGVEIVHEVELFEISIVSIPANDMALVTEVKSMDQITERDIEKALRDLGLSQKQSKTLLARGYKAIANEPEHEILEILKKYNDTIREFL